MRARIPTWVAALAGAGIVCSLAFTELPVPDMSVTDLRGRAPLAAPPTDIPAFWGVDYDDRAHGYGGTAMVPCRALPLAVHHVTSLATSGDGSLNAVMSDSISDATHDVIVFDTAGVQAADTNVRIDLETDCVYIAGQTAQGGFAVQRDDNGVAWFRWGETSTNNTQDSVTTDVVIRYLHVWSDICNGPPCNSSYDNMEFLGAKRVVVDHVSFHGSKDEMLYFATYRGNRAGNFSATRNLFATGFDGHGHLAGIVDIGVSSTSTSDDALEYWTWAGNAHIWVDHRLPAFGGDSINTDTVSYGEILNNVYYGWSPRIVSATVMHTTDFVGNRARPAGGVGSDADDIYQLRGAIASNPNTVDWLLYAADNISGSVLTASQSLWAVGIFKGEGGAAIGTDSTVHKKASRFGETSDSARHNWPLLSPDSAWALLVTAGRVGAYKYLACDGTWVEYQTSLDSLALQDAADSTKLALSGGSSYPDSILDHPLGGFPSLTAAGPRCADSDSDDLWDATEVAWFGSITVTDAADSVAADGYRLIEHMVNGTTPPGNPTYGVGLYIYRAPATVDTLCLDGPPGAGANVTTCPTADTLLDLGYAVDSIPAGGVGRECTDTLNVRYRISTSALSGGNLIDSLAYDTLSTAITQPGCDTASVKAWAGS